MVTTITFQHGPSVEINTLESRLADLDYYLQNNIRALITRQNTLNELRPNYFKTKAFLFLQQTLDKRPRSLVTMHLHDSCQTHANFYNISDLRQRLQTARNNIRAMQQRIDAQTQERSEIQQKLAMLRMRRDSASSIDIEKLVTCLNATPGIKKVRTAFDDKVFMLAFTLESMAAQCVIPNGYDDDDDNGFYFYNRVEQKFTAPQSEESEYVRVNELPPITIPEWTCVLVVSRINSGVWSITALGDTRFYAYDSCFPLVHPHWIGTHPCFGDFGNTVKELIQKTEFESFVDIMLLYNTSIDPNDSAGSYALTWNDDKCADSSDTKNANQTCINYINRFLREQNSTLRYEIFASSELEQAA